MARKVLLIGWPGVDWSVLHRLLDDGSMPATQQLIDRGVVGRLAAVAPIEPYSLWTSVATGQRAHVHGILGVQSVDRDATSAVASTATARRVPALWEMLDAQALHSHVVGWPATTGSQAIAGTIVTEVFGRPDMAKTRSTLAAAVVPSDLEAELADQWMHPEETTAEVAREFLHDRCGLETIASGRLNSVAYELLRAAAHRAAASGFSSLSHQTYLDPEDPRALTLRAMGFSPRESIDEFQCSYTSVWNRCRRIHERLGADKGPPSEIRITSLERAVLPAVRARLHEERIMDTLDFDDRLRPGHGQPTDREKSTVLLAGDTLIAVMLVAPFADGRGYAVPARWVAPEYRRGWANVVLIYHSTAQGQELGLDYIRFVANSKAHDETVRLSQRLGGHRVTSRHRYALRLTNP